MRTDNHRADIERLSGRVGLAAVWADLDRRLRRGVAPALPLLRAWTWDRADRADRRWWPQGISVAPGGRRVVTSWYAKDGGSRASFLDLEAGRYRHVDLVRPTPGGLVPLTVHAGGLAWREHLLYIGATRAGLWVCDTRDVVRTPTGYALPVEYRLAPSEPFRFSFVGLAGDDLVVGEYQHDRRLALVGTDGTPALVTEAGIARMQGAAHVGGHWYVTTSHGPWRPGSIWAGGRRRRYAVPMGPEDLAHDPLTDRLWTLTEHPHRRWIVSMPRTRLG